MQMCIDSFTAFSQLKLHATFHFVAWPSPFPKIFSRHKWVPNNQSENNNKKHRSIQFCSEQKFAVMIIWVHPPKKKNQKNLQIIKNSHNVACELNNMVPSDWSLDFILSSRLSHTENRILIQIVIHAMRWVIRHCRYLTQSESEQCEG